VDRPPLKGGKYCAVSRIGFGYVDREELYPRAPVDGVFPAAVHLSELVLRSVACVRSREQWTLAPNGKGRRYAATRRASPSHAAVERK
jgi:hypothetical protein